MIDKKAKFYVIDAYSLAKSLGLGGRINVIMQTAFFAISGVLPQEKALKMIELAVEDTYGDKGKAVVEMNIRAASLAGRAHPEGRAAGQGHAARSTCARRCRPTRRSSCRRSRRRSSPAAATDCRCR